MASAEHLLHEAQYAFQSISYGETRENARNARRAKSLCMKIIRKFPASMEAGEAHAVLRRLGEEAYASKMKVRHRHISQATHHEVPPAQPQSLAFVDSEGQPLDWGGLISWIVTLPKTVLGAIAFGGVFLFGLFGPFLFLPLLALVLLTGPFRQMLKPEQRQEMDTFIAKVNTFITEQRNSGNNFS